MNLNKFEKLVNKLGLEQNLKKNSIKQNSYSYFR
ncbi:protein of unknown function (DUF1967) [Snodgrassella alvi SCGC AB-598-O02]|nr:protein of unknown function (DUF1967) [Snodgrassella alvi SCGC AB-598-O02]